MDAEFAYVGYVEQPAKHPYLVVEARPGMIPLALVNDEAGNMLGYFPEDRRPKVGTRVGVQGSWVKAEVPLAPLSPGERRPPGKPVQFQLEVESWTPVSADYDPLGHLYE